MGGSGKKAKLTYTMIFDFRKDISRKSAATGGGGPELN